MLRRDILEALANFPNAGLWGHTGPKACVGDLLQHGLFNELQVLRMLVMATFIINKRVFSHIIWVILRLLLLANVHVGCTTNWTWHEFLVQHVGTLSAEHAVIAGTDTQHDQV